MQDDDLRRRIRRAAASLFPAVYVEAMISDQNNRSGPLTQFPKPGDFRVIGHP